jgi:predicted transcriptional regulator
MDVTIHKTWDEQMRPQVRIALASTPRRNRLQTTLVINHDDSVIDQAHLIAG